MASLRWILLNTRGGMHLTRSHPVSCEQKERCRTLCSSLPRHVIGTTFQQLTTPRVLSVEATTLGGVPDRSGCGRPAAHFTPHRSFIFSARAHGKGESDRRERTVHNSSLLSLVRMRRGRSWRASEASAVAPAEQAGAPPPPMGPLVRLRHRGVVAGCGGPASQRAREPACSVAPGGGRPVAASRHPPGALGRASPAHRRRCGKDERQPGGK
jgi:hypothetical protein